MTTYPNTYAIIDLKNLADNFHKIEEKVKGKTVICVVKADAYGHGATRCAMALEESGAQYFAVSSLDEAMELRDAGIKSPILILGYVPIERIDKSLRYDLTYTIYSMTFANALNKQAQEHQTQAKVHIKINTGMNRLGFKGHDNVLRKAREIASMNSLHLEGIFSHYATADDADLSFTEQQHKLFRAVIDELIKENIHIPMVHISNSAGSSAYLSDITTAVRTGILLYGINPSNSIHEDVIPVMNLYSTVANISRLNKDESVSYGRTYFANNAKKIAVISAGYADGYFRSLSNKGEVSIRGKRAKIVGNICMDMFMVDITHIEHVAVGDQVTLFGDDPTATELAELIGTIPYELTCSLSKKRVRRIYKNI